MGCRRGMGRAAPSRCLRGRGPWAVGAGLLGRGHGLFGLRALWCPHVLPTPSLWGRLLLGEGRSLARRVSTAPSSQWLACEGPEAGTHPPVSIVTRLC